MASRGRTPEKGLRVRTWSFDRCDDGKERMGWLSGDMCILLSHVGKQRSKPCQKELLGPDAPCPECGKRPREDLGYVPLRRDDGRPMCVVIRKSTLDFVEGIKLGTPVAWGREEGRFEGVYIRPTLKGVPWDRYYPEKPNDDLAVWLPMFLGVPELADAMRVYLSPRRECQPVVTEPLPAPVESPPPMTEAVATEKSRIDEMLAARTLDDTTASLRRKAARLKAEQNGTGGH